MQIGTSVSSALIVIVFHILFAGGMALVRSVNSDSGRTATNNVGNPSP